MDENETDTEDHLVLSTDPVPESIPGPKTSDPMKKEPLRRSNRKKSLNPYYHKRATALLDDDDEMLRTSLLNPRRRGRVQMSQGRLTKLPHQQ